MRRKCGGGILRGMTRAFLATYRPLCRTRAGQEAVARFGIPPYVDGSCRREPDLEAQHPTITALCRAGQFAPRLREGDHVVYITKKGRYGGAAPHWRLVAILEVIERCKSHEEAAAWHRGRDLPLPRNLMIEGSSPAPLHETDSIVPKSCGGAKDELAAWDAEYRERAQRWPMVLICDAKFRELHEPPVIEQSHLPGTRNPPQLRDELWEQLRRLARVSFAP
jgi:hypothetical protein